MKQILKLNVQIASAVCGVLLLFTGNVFGQGTPATETEATETKTVIGDLLMIDRDLYIVRGERGEIQIEATYKTQITEEFKFGDRIKALVLMNNKALKIERAGPSDVPGVVENRPVVAKAPVPAKVESGTAKAVAPPVISSTQPKQPDQKIIIGDLLMIDRDLYIIRGDRGEIQIEATLKTEITEKFKFGDRIKAVVLIENNKAVKIERAGANEVSGVTTKLATSTPVPENAQAQPIPQNGGQRQVVQPTNPIPSTPPSETRIVKGQILMIDGDFYVLRGEHGEIRVERTYKTKVTEEFKFGDFIKATVKPNDQALVIEREK
jgi:exosome complex RNA-binding protein Csl4